MHFVIDASMALDLKGCVIDGESFVRPEHIRELAVPVLAHRLALDPHARFAGGSAQAIVEHIMQTLPVPA